MMKEKKPPLGYFRTWETMDAMPCIVKACDIKCVGEDIQDKKAIIHMGGSGIETNETRFVIEAKIKATNRREICWMLGIFACVVAFIISVIITGVELGWIPQ
jgi:hypothetical protein